MFKDQKQAERLFWMIVRDAGKMAAREARNGLMPTVAVSRDLVAELTELYEKFSKKGD